MDAYVTGAAIRCLRGHKGLTQAELAERIGVSAKAVSKWETGRGLPDVSLLDPLAAELGVSVMELLAGSAVSNRNLSSNMLRSVFYACPVCGNVIHAMGEAAISCCGVQLPKTEAEEADQAHQIKVEAVEDEHYITVAHEMTKQHHISFLAYVTNDGFHMVKLYPEGPAACRFRLRGSGYLYLSCNRHGLMRQKIGRLGRSTE